MYKFVEKILCKRWGGVRGELEVYLNLVRFPKTNEFPLNFTGAAHIQVICRSYCISDLDELTYNILIVNQSLLENN